MKLSSDNRGKVTLEAMLSSKQSEVHCRLVGSTELPETSLKERSIMKTILLVLGCTLLPIMACLAASTFLATNTETSVAAYTRKDVDFTENWTTRLLQRKTVTSSSTIPVTFQPPSTSSKPSTQNTTMEPITESTPHRVVDFNETSFHHVPDFAETTPHYVKNFSETTNGEVDVSTTTPLTNSNVFTDLNWSESNITVRVPFDQGETIRTDSPTLMQTSTTTFKPQQELRSPNVYRKFPMKPKNVYFVNDTLLGQQVPCSDAEKECLRFNRILFPEDGKCYALGDGPRGCHFVVNRLDFENMSKHIRGKCAPENMCRPFSTKHIKFAYDEQCVKMRHVRNFCGRGPVDLIQHFFGGYECIPVPGVNPQTPIYISQPKESGSCAFPNLRHDLTSVLDQEKKLLIKDCSEEQSVCFARNKVWCSEQRMCCNLLRRNHCPSGQWVVLSRKSWEHSEVTSLCQGVNPCAGDARLMAFDGQCHSKTEVLRVLCPKGVLLPNAFGEMSCVTRDFYKHVIDLKSNRPAFCEIVHRLSHDEQVQGMTLTPECGLTGFRSCVDAF